MTHVQSLEYLTMKELYPDLVSVLSPTIERLGDVLYGEELLTENILHTIQQATLTPQDKVRKLLNCLISHTQYDPSVYHQFVKALENEECPITKDIAKTIKSTYKQKWQKLYNRSASESPLMNSQFTVPRKSSVDCIPTLKPSLSPVSSFTIHRAEGLKQSSSSKEQSHIANPLLGTPPLSHISTDHRPILNAEDWAIRSGKLLKSTVKKAFSLANNATRRAETSNKDTKFQPVLILPSQLLSPGNQLDLSDASLNQLAIRVLDQQEGTESIWTIQDLEKTLDSNEEMFVNTEKKPCLLGVASFSLECLRYNVAHDHTAPLLSPSGEVCGALRVEIKRVSASYTLSGIDVDRDLPLEDTISCQINVVEASGLPKEYCHNVFCQYKFWQEATVNIDPPLIQSNLQELSEGCQKFDNTQVFMVNVTEDFLSFIETNGVLAVEVWGQMESRLLLFPTTDGEQGQSLGVADRLKERIQSLELWVEIKELNHHGEYISVEKRRKTDVSTGGVFRIQQGHAQRISVSVSSCTESDGRIPFELERISSISIGSISLHNRENGPFDSFHRHDLDRLWKKWSELLGSYEVHLNGELDKASNCSDRKRAELLQKRRMLLSLKTEVSKYKDNSAELPGVPTSSSKLGFESRVPAILIDALRSPADATGVAASPPRLHGETDEAMIDLTITETQERMGRLHAVASWDPTIHNDTSLNTPTEKHYRVYAILKVCVALTNPPGFTLELRKRISLKVFNRRILGSLRQIFAAREQTNGCGIGYNVIVGIPRAEGIWPPPTIPRNPSVVELTSDEDLVEKLKNILSNITDKLTISMLQQEVSLKMKVTESGKPLRTKRMMSKCPLQVPFAKVHTPSSQNIEHVSTHSLLRLDSISSHSSIRVELFGSSSTLGLSVEEVVSPKVTDEATSLLERSMKRRIAKTVPTPKRNVELKPVRQSKTEKSSYGRPSSSSTSATPNPMRYPTKQPKAPWR